MLRSPTSLALRPYQKEAVEALEKAYQKGNRGLLSLPTGAGKTFTAAYFLSQRKEKIIWTAHMFELLVQAKETFSRIGNKTTSFYTAKEKDLSGDVVLAQIQTCVRTLPQIEGPCILVIDEGHRSAANSYKKLEEHLNPEWVLLLTATPYRLDGKDLGVSAPTYSVSLEDLVKQKYLARPIYIRVELDVADFKFASNNSDFTKETLSKIGLVSERNKEIASYIINNQSVLGKTLVFLPSIDSSKQVLRALRRGGVQAAAIDGSTPKEEREGLVKAFQKGDLTALLNVQVFTEGFDVPDVKTVVLGRPTISKVLWSQMVGRGARIAPGKDSFYIIDFVDAQASASAAYLAKDVIGEPLPEKIKEKENRRKKQDKILSELKKLKVRISREEVLSVARIVSIPGKRAANITVFDKDIPLLRGARKAIEKRLGDPNIYAFIHSLYDRAPERPRMSRASWNNICWATYKYLKTGQNSITTLWSNGEKYPGTSVFDMSEPLSAVPVEVLVSRYCSFYRKVSYSYTTVIVEVGDHIAWPIVGAVSKTLSRVLSKALGDEVNVIVKKR